MNNYQSFTNLPDWNSSRSWIPKQILSRNHDDDVEICYKNKEEQIIGTQDKPQCLVAQRLLSHLQYPDATKSSTKDLSPAAMQLTLGLVGGNHLSIVTTDEIRRVYFFSRNARCGGQHCLVSMDSDLEAFSRNPTRGSFAALAFQPAAFTNYANLVFLSY